MHEMALCESVLDIVSAQVARSGGGRVSRVRLEIGALSHVSAEAMEFCFPAVAKGSVAEGAVLEILRPPGRAVCLECGRENEIAARFDPCPNCGSFGLKVTGGDELRVRDMEIA